MTHSLKAFTKKKFDAPFLQFFSLEIEFSENYCATLHVFLKGIIIFPMEIYEKWCCRSDSGWKSLQKSICCTTWSSWIMYFLPSNIVLLWAELLLIKKLDVIHHIFHLSLSIIFHTSEKRFFLFYFHLVSTIWLTDLYFTAGKDEVLC